MKNIKMKTLRNVIKDTRKWGYTINLLLIFSVFCHGDPIHPRAEDDRFKLDSLFENTGYKKTRFIDRFRDVCVSKPIKYYNYEA